MRSFLIVFSLLFSFSAYSSTDIKQYQSDPFKLVEAVSNNLFERITSDKEAIKNNPELLRGIIEEEMAPAVNHKYAAAKVLGPYLKKSKKSEVKEFMDVFREYLIATFAGVMTLYQEQKVVFEPGKVEPGKKIVVVKVRVIEEGKPDIGLQFKMRYKSKDNTWSAYDMIAEGVSVLDSKRAELQSLIRQQGLVSVTELLREKAAKPITVKEV